MYQVPTIRTKKKKDKIIEIVEQRMRYFTEKEVIPE